MGIAFNLIFKAVTLREIMLRAICDDEPLLFALTFQFLRPLTKAFWKNKFVMIFHTRVLES